jgi:hypothetical protein
VDFVIDPRTGLRGTVSFVATALGPDSTLLRHDTRARTVGAMRLGWPLFLRWMHDACVEDLLDRAQDAVGAPPVRRARHPVFVRVLRPVTEREPVREVSVPHTALVAAALADIDWSDAHAVARPSGAPADPQAWADALFHRRTRAGTTLIAVRDALAGLVGITRSHDRSFATVATAPDEVLLGSDERHLDFRASVLVEAQRVVLSTVVRRHNLRGRVYFAVVRQLHPTVVRAMLARAARELSTPAVGRRESSVS